MKSPQLQAELEEEQHLAARVQELSNNYENAFDNQQRKFLLKELALAISTFDDHIKQTIKSYPEYYSEYKKHLDAVLVQNANFLNVSIEELSALEKVNKAN